MKKIISSVMLLAAAASAFVSCNKSEIAGEPAGKTTVFHINAVASDTKTVFGEKGENGYPVKWTENKQVRFSINQTNTAVDVTPNLVGEGANASFAPEFTGIDESGYIYAFSPMGNYNSSPKVPGFTGFVKNSTAIYLSIPSEQTPLVNSVDEAAQAMVGVQAYSDSNTEINMTFTHLVAYGKMTVTGFDGTIASVKLQFPENIAGISVVYNYISGEITGGKSVSSITLDPANVENNVFWFALAPTAGTTGEMKIIITDSNDDTYTKTIDLTAKNLPFIAGQVSAFTANFEGVEKDAPTVDYVTLPWTWEGGVKSDFEAIAGVTASGLGSDYAAGNAPYRIKLDTTGDYFIVKTDSEIGAITIGVKMLGGATSSSLTISGSADGKTYTEVQKLTISGAQNDILNLSTTAAFDETYRYVKAYFTKGSNVGMGAVSITKPSAEKAIAANDITAVDATGVSNAEASYTAQNFTDDVEVASVSGCVTAATAGEGIVLYDVAPNYTGEESAGTIVLQSASDNSITKTVNVTQAADVFTISTDALALGATVSSTAKFTVTSSYAFTISNPDDTKISISPVSSDGGSSAIEITVTALTANTDTENTIEVGDITITRTTGEGDTNKTKTVAVTQDKAAAAGTTTDVLTADMFAATTTTYTDFSEVTATSNAVYAGNSGKDSSGNIQMRSKNSNSGIVSTTSGGTVKSVKITVGSGSNTIDVYGSNTAYTAASDLYNTSTQGTKIGSVSATGTVIFNTDTDYTYVGIRSNNGAIYLSSVEIVWE